MKIIVTLPHDHLWTALEWAKKNCPSYITNDVHQDGYYTYDISKVDYFFSEESDATIFALRWL